MVFLFCKGNCIVVCVGLSDKECLFQFRLDPKDEIMNLLFFWDAPDGVQGYRGHLCTFLVKTPVVIYVT